MTSKEEEKGIAATPPNPLPDCFPVDGNDILRDPLLDQSVQFFREELQAEFETCRSADGLYYEYRPLGTDWRVVHRNKDPEFFWAFRDKEFVYGSNCLQTVLKAIKKIKRKETDEKEEEEEEPEKRCKSDYEYEVDRDPFWAPIAREVVDKVGQRGRVRYNLSQTLGEEDYVVFLVDQKWTIRARKDGTFSGSLFDVNMPEFSGTLDEVLAWLDPVGPEKQFEHSVRFKIRQWQKHLARMADERTAWKQAQQSASELQLLLSRLGNPDWGPETNTRGFYFGLQTLVDTAKTKAAEPPLDLEKAVVGECLKEMTNLATEEIVKRLEVVSRLIKEQQQQ